MAFQISILRYHFVFLKNDSRRIILEIRQLMTYILHLTLTLQKAAQSIDLIVVVVRCTYVQPFGKKGSFLTLLNLLQLGTTVNCGFRVTYDHYSDPNLIVLCGVDSRDSTSLHFRAIPF